MAVIMERSTDRGPVSLSTWYLIGSAVIGISMITLKSSGSARPGVTRSRFMADLDGWSARHCTPPAYPWRPGQGKLPRRPGAIRCKEDQRKWKRRGRDVSRRRVLTGWRERTTGATILPNA